MEDDKKLLADVRNYLDITWEDPEGDAKLLGILQRGKSYLDGLCGSPQDYGMEGQARALLLDYCRYARNNLSEQFDKNFQGPLLMLQLDRKAEDYAASQTDGTV